MGATEVVNNLAQATHSQGEVFDSEFPSLRGAQAFSTDGNSYTLDTISAQFEGFAASSSAEIALWSDSGGFPGSVIETLGNVTILAGTVTQALSSTSNPTLAPNTQYWVVITYVSGDFNFDYTTSGASSGGYGSGLGRLQ